MHSAISLIQGDITTQSVDAIVNAANSSLMGGGGVDGAIHRAGGPAILEECKAIVHEHGELPTGHAVMTTADDLPARHVIHTVGPIYRDGNHGEDQLLAMAYQNCLQIAHETNLRSLAFPSISTGAYRFPTDRAAHIALATIDRFLTTFPLKQVIMVLFAKTTFDVFQKNYNSLSEKA